MNKPYAGGYITRHYGNPERQMHAIQIEIRRDLYMNELSKEFLEHKAQNIVSFLKSCTSALSSMNLG